MHATRRARALVRAVRRALLRAVREWRHAVHENRLFAPHLSRLLKRILARLSDSKENMAKLIAARKELSAAQLGVEQKANCRHSPTCSWRKVMVSKSGN